MKFSIKYLDEVSFEFTLAQTAAGKWEVESVFPVFLGRPGRPHLSLFSKPNGSRFTPHATVWKDTPRQSRLWLPKFSPEVAARWNDEVGAAMYAEYVRSLEPVDLEAATEDGWTAHWADWRVLGRWLRKHCRPGGSLLLSASAVDSLCLHVVKHGTLPRYLSEITDSRCLLMLRWSDDADEPEMRTLFHFPDGVPLPDGAGSVEIVRERGWYSTPPRWNDAVSRQLTVGTRFEQAARQVQNFLERHPRRSGGRSPKPELPSLSGLILGFCAADMVRLALNLVIER